MFGPVGLIAREQDHMVSPFHRADTIHLHETQLLDQPMQGVFVLA
jgi:hypothetical protein